MWRRLGWFELVPDLRSLAFFRIALGLVICVNLLNWLPHLDFLLGDEGALPRAALWQNLHRTPHWSLLLAHGSLTWIYLLWGVAFSSAAAYMLGFRHRTASLLLWIWHWSAVSRNVYCHDRGDLELGLLLLFSMFLPLSQRWSVGNTRDCQASKPTPIVIPALAFPALVLQISQIYLFTAILKECPAWTERGDGLQLSLEAALFAKPTALWLSRHLLWPKFLSFAIVALEFIFGLAILCPGKMRTASVFVIASFHLCIAFLFDLHCFPWIAAAATLALLPRSFWETRPDEPTKLGSLVCKALDSTFGAIGAPAACSGEAVPQKQVADIGLALIVALSSTSNIYTLPFLQSATVPTPVKVFNRLFHLEQHWELFRPPPYNGWFVLEETLPDKSRLNRLPNPPQPLSAGEQWPRPEAPNHYYPYFRIKMLLVTTLFEGGAPYRQQFTQSLARRQGVPGDHPVRLLFVYFPVRDDGSYEPLREWVLWEGKP